MADYNSSLPVRTEADADERLQSKIVDYTTATQGMSVDSDGNAHVEVHGDNPTGGDETLRLSQLGHATLDGIYDATNNTDPSQVGMVAHTRAASPADSDQVKRLTAVTDGSVHALDISLHDEDGVAYSSSNPLPVEFFENLTESYDYNTASAVAAGASSTHTYAAPSGFKLFEVHCAGSGKMKAELQINGVTVAVGFNSTANPNIEFRFEKGLNASGVNVAVIRTNKDNQAQDLYSTFSGAI